MHDPKKAHAEQPYVKLCDGIKLSTERVINPQPEAQDHEARPEETQPETGGTERVDQGQNVDDIPHDWHNQFKPALTLRAMREPMLFRLMVSIPHLTVGTTVGTTDRNATERTLERYRWNNRGLDTPRVHGSPWEDPLFVHQSMFMVINSGMFCPSSLITAPLTPRSVDMIVMARTADDTQSSLLPFFPNQLRVSALHLLVHMISTVLQFSTRSVLDRLRKISLNLVRIDHPPRDHCRHGS